jgi:hypothetical protein
MKRLLFAGLFAGIAAALPIPRMSLPPAVTVIETAGPATPLDAALILRAIFRYSPKSVTFLDPLAGEDGRSFLDSKLADTKVPVSIGAGSAKTGSGKPLPDSVPSISFDGLMVRTERSERGEVSLDLDGLFRNRAVLVERTGGGGVAQMIPEEPWARPVWKWSSVLLAASLPWWPFGRVERGLIALGVGCGWGLLGMALQQELGVALPWIYLPLLAIFAVIPADLHLRKVQQRKPAA